MSEILTEFIGASSTLENRFVKEWKNRGGKVIGYTCSYLPDEVIHSAGILPFRIRGHGAKECTIGDTYFGPFICTLPKCMLQLAGEGAFKFLDGVIITPGCDSMRRLDECWRKAGEDFKGIVPDFFFHFGVPHKCSDYTLKWFSDEILRLMAHMKRVFNVEVTNKLLSESIHIHNRTRALMREFDSIRTMSPPPISGADALAVILAGSTMPREIYNDKLEKIIKELKEASSQSSKSRPRLMLVGSAADDVGLVRLIEDSGSSVVADNLCFSARFHLEPVSEKEDPIPALAKWYLSRNECPRMYGDYEGRLNLLKKKIKSAGIQGVILQNIRFCDLHGSENGLFERELEAEGVPCLKIEREYGPLVEKGRLKIRVDAFLERINART